MRPFIPAAALAVSLCLPACGPMVAPFDDRHAPEAITTVVDNNIKLTYVEVDQNDPPTTVTVPGHVQYLVLGSGKDHGGLKRIEFTTSDIAFTDGTKSAVKDFNGAQVPISASVAKSIKLEPREETTLRTTVSDHQGHVVKAADVLLKAPVDPIDTEVWRIDSQTNDGHLLYAAWTTNNTEVKTIAPNCADYIKNGLHPKGFSAPSVFQGETAFARMVRPTVAGAVRYKPLTDNCYTDVGVAIFTEQDVQKGIFKPVAATNITVDGIWMVAPDKLIGSTIPHLIIQWEPVKIIP